jgi:soluble lytic murein transglycosylase
MGQAIARWKLLNASDQFRFDDYSGFLLTYPGFPEGGEAARLCRTGAGARGGGAIAPSIAYFDRFPPLTNPGRARHALALAALGRRRGARGPLTAWRGGPMNDAARPALLVAAWPHPPADHDARMNALLWASAGAGRTPDRPRDARRARAGFMTRLGLVKAIRRRRGCCPTDLRMRDSGLSLQPRAAARTVGNGDCAALLANRPPLTASRRSIPRRWIAELLAAAAQGRCTQRRADRRRRSTMPSRPAPMSACKPSPARRLHLADVAGRHQGAVVAGRRPPRRAAVLPLWRRRAAPPQTRSKGFYWAGRAARRPAMRPARTLFRGWPPPIPITFTAMLALERLGRPLPAFSHAHVVPTPASAPPSTRGRSPQAVREVARGANGGTVRFFKEIAEQAESESRSRAGRRPGPRDRPARPRRDPRPGRPIPTALAISSKIAFPMMPVPPGTNWTMVHAITRQESQFAMNAISHAGARGLMQLMPGTAREQAGKVGLSYTCPR